MKIGMIVEDLSVSGGYQKLVLRLAKELLKLEHDVFLYTLRIDKDKCYPEMIKDIDIVQLDKRDVYTGFFSDIYRKVNAYKILDRDYKDLSKKIKNDLDCIILHNESCLYSLSRTLPSFKTKPKVLWMLNNQTPELFYRNYISIVINNFYRTKEVRTLVGNFLSLPSTLMHYFRIKKEVKHIDTFLTYDSFNKKLLEKENDFKVLNVLAGADIEEFNEVKDKKEGGAIKILSVGVLFPYRRYEDLIEAISILKKENLKISATIVGLHTFSKNYSKKLKKIISERHLEELVEFKEFATKEELHKLYVDANIFVFVNDGNTWGISVFEAISSNTPVIITNNIGAADLVKNNVSGLVIEPRNPNQLANSIKVLLDKDRANKFCVEAKKILPEVSWGSYALRIQEIIK